MWGMGRDIECAPAHVTIWEPMATPFTRMIALDERGYFSTAFCAKNATTGTKTTSDIPMITTPHSLCIT